MPHERSTSPDKDNPGRLNVVITGDTMEEVQGEIFNLEFDGGYRRLEFSLPKVRNSDQRWEVKGWVMK